MSANEVKWASLTFSDLEEVFIRQQSPLVMSQSEREMLARYGEIQCFLSEDHIWPPTPSVHAKFDAVFQELLTRLPETVFDAVQSGMSFIIEDPKVEMRAVNVPPPAGQGPGQGVNTIVVFHSSWGLGQSALVGLLVHEIAHSFVRGSDYAEDELLADKQVGIWGFGEELAELRAESVFSAYETRFDNADELFIPELLRSEGFVDLCRKALDRGARLEQFEVDAAIPGISWEF